MPEREAVHVFFCPHATPCARSSDSLWIWLGDQAMREVFLLLFSGCILLSLVLDTMTRPYISIGLNIER